LGFVSAGVALVGLPSVGHGANGDFQAAILHVEDPADSKRSVTVTIRSDGSWKADDPKAILPGKDEGRYTGPVSNTVTLWDGDASVLVLTNFVPKRLSEDHSGGAQRDGFAAQWRVFKLYKEE
jgi:hypothetical protein